MDCVILYKALPTAHEGEILYTIRSVTKNLKFDNLIVIGDKPSFLSDKAIHIDLTLKDDHVKRDCLFKHVDMLAKAKAIIADERISKDFIWCNDDMYILKPFEEVFPYYYNKKVRDWHDAQNNWEIAGGKKSKTWNYYIEEAYKNFPDGNWFEVHCPIVFNKRKLSTVINKYKLKHLGTIRTHYANHCKIEGVPTIDYKAYTVQKFKEYKSAPFMSTTNVMGRFQPLKMFLREKFKEKTIYEK